MKLENAVVGIIGLGYVGLPLAVEFGKKRTTVGFDIKSSRVAELENGRDSTLEVDSDDLAASTHLTCTSNVDDLRNCHVFIVTVPTPTDKANRPDLTPLEKASVVVGQVMEKGAIVIYESTVYPGCTEEVCARILERESGLKLNEDFFVGYSPERINPGDKEHRLTTITKVTAGSTPEAANAIDKLYCEIVEAGTHKASSIKVAEAAKVIENTQRDLNIALMNELALIFSRLGIDTLDVLEAAETKWNFLPFRPGLVGGHCIGVDPYYLTHKAQEVGYHPEIILAGRRINDGMGRFVADEVIKLMAKRNLPVAGGRVLVLGLTFKENCPDLRNTRVIDVIQNLMTYNIKVDVYDPWIEFDKAVEEYGIKCLKTKPALGAYDGIVLAVSHRQFSEMGSDGIRAFGKDGAVLFDVKGILPRQSADGRL